MSNKIQFDEEDRLDLLNAVSKVAVGLLSNQLKTIPVAISIEIPEGIHEVITKVAYKTQTNPEEIFTKLAYQGLQNSLQGLLQEAKQQDNDTTKEEVDVADQMKALGLDIGPFLKKFGEFQQVLQKVQDLQKVAEDVATRVDAGDHDSAEKNSK